MKLATYAHGDEDRVGVVKAGQVYDLRAALKASGKGDRAAAASVKAAVGGRTRRVGRGAGSTCLGRITWGGRCGAISGGGDVTRPHYPVPAS